MKKMSLDTAVAFLRGIDNGEHVAARGNQHTFDENWSADVDWRFEGGWELVVFNDCGEWDYVDRITNYITGEWCEFSDWHAPLTNERGEWTGYDGGDVSAFIRNWYPTDRGLESLKLTRRV